MSRSFAAFSVGVAVLAASGSLVLKNHVQAKVEQAELLARKISEDRAAIRVLRAEHAYLSSPGRIQRQAIEHLAMMPPLPDQIIRDIDDVPYRSNGDRKIGQSGTQKNSKTLKAKQKLPGKEGVL